MAPGRIVAIVAALTLAMPVSADAATIQITIENLVISPPLCASLRANGSRGRAPDDSLREAIQSSSFRGDAKHRARNLEIPRCAIAHLRSGPSDHPRNDDG